MKKTLVLLTLSLFIFGNSYANDSRINEFVDWLYKNGHSQYVKEVDICKEYKKYSKGAVQKKLPAKNK